MNKFRLMKSEMKVQEMEMYGLTSTEETFGVKSLNV